MTNVDININTKKIYKNIDEKNDANIIFQMMLLKVHSLKKALEGFKLKYNNIDSLDYNVIDPINISLITRNIYETLVTFYMIYIYPNCKEDKELSYKLWVLSGKLNIQKILVNRINIPIQSIDDIKKMYNIIEEIDNSEHNKDIERLMNERYAEQIEQKRKIDIEVNTLTKDIANNKLFKKSKNDIKKFKKALSGKFIYKIDNDKIVQIDWFECMELLNFDKNFTNEIYRLFSLECHPTHQSILRFGDYFRKSEANLDSIITKTNHTFAFISTFIIEYLKYDIDILSYFQSLDDETKGRIDFYNTFYRGINYSIFNIQQSNIS